MLSDDLDTVRVVSRPTAWTLAGVSEKTWERMEARGETPPKTRISPNRIGYRVCDIKVWLDARREVPAT